MKNTIAGLIIASAGFVSMSTAAYAECGEVSITEMDWASSAVVTSVSKFIMENGYGCTVNTVPSATVTALASLAEKGEPDIVTEIWPAIAQVYYEIEAAGKVVALTDVLSDGGEDGWWIPAYLAEEHPELKTIDGILANPELVGARFHNCPVGWGCRITNDHLAIAFDLADNGIEVFNHGSGETLATSIGAAYADKAPWFGYYWAPTAILGKYSMVKVDMGPVHAEIAKCNASEDCATPGKTAWPAATVLTGMAKSFYDKNPEIVTLMSNVSFTNAQMGDILAWKDANNASADEAAVYFLTSYKDVWSAWLNDSAKEKLAGIIK